MVFPCFTCPPAVATTIGIEKPRSCTERKAAPGAPVCAGFYCEMQWFLNIFVYRTPAMALQCGCSGGFSIFYFECSGRRLCAGCG